MGFLTGLARVAGKTSAALPEQGCHLGLAGPAAISVFWNYASCSALAGSDGTWR